MPPPPGADPVALGRLAVKRGLLSEADLRTVVQELAEAPPDRAGQGQPPTLAEALLERKLLDVGQIRTLQEELSRDDVTPKVHQSPLADPPACKPITIDATASSTRRSFGKYMLVREIGRGGMSVVWEAYDTDLRRRAAIKFLTGVGGRYIDAAQEEILKRFYREAHSAAKLSHNNIVKIFEVGELDGQHYIAMEYVDGQTLYDLMRKKTANLRAIVTALRDSGRALEHAHRHGILHRDIKPQNIMIDAEGRTTVMDFGLARDLREDERLTLSGIAIGTPNYMPPEHAQGSKHVIDVRSDVYSLGAVLYEVLAQRAPFPGDTPMAVMLAVVNQEVVRPSRVRASVPADLETICLKAMEKDKERRYPSAAAMADDLERWLRGEPIQARRASLLYQARRRARRYAALIAGASAALLLAAGWLAYAAREVRGRQQIARDDAERARALAARGELSEAVGLLEAAAKLDPSFLPELDELRRRQAREEEEELARRREADVRQKVRDEFAAASAKYHRHEYADALPGMNRVLELDPSHQDALHLRGHIHMHDRRDQEALQDWKRLQELNPQSAEASKDLGNLHYSRLGDPESALAQYRRSLDINPRQSSVLDGIGHILKDRGELDEAMRHFTEALKIQPTGEFYADRAEVRALLYHKGGHRDPKMLDDAFLDCQTALELGKTWHAYFSRGYCHHERRQFDRAIADYEEALRLGPPHPERIQSHLEQSKRAQEKQSH